MKKKGNKKMPIPRQEIIDNPIPTSLFFNKITCIRASVDALCRDGADEISRDPRRKRLKPRRESLAKPSKPPSNCCLAHL